MSGITARRLRLALAALCAMPAVALPQARSIAGTAVGVTIQAIGTDEGIAEIPAVGLHITSIWPSRLGLDIALNTIPNALVSGFLVLAPDVGVARLFPVGGGALMIKAGPSAVIAGSPGGFGFVGGAHIGAAAFVRLGPNFGLRAEVVPRFYAGEGGVVQVTTYGIGFTSLPGGSR